MHTLTKFGVDFHDCYSFIEDCNDFVFLAYSILSSQMHIIGLKIVRKRLEYIY